MKITTQSLFFLALLVLSGQALAKVNIFACEPEWAALSREIGGNLVKVKSATTGLQDPHHIQARPSLLARARRADLLVCTGAELEIGWLPVLLQKTGNPRIQPGQPGYFMATDAVRLLDIPAKLDRSLGDVHAAGNPHIQTDPRRIAKVAKALSARLQQIDSAHAADYQKHYADFDQRWTTALQGWQQQAAGLRGKSIIVQHKSWVYLENWLGLKELATLELKPGVPATTGHLSKVLSLVQSQHADAIIYAAYQSPKSARWLAKKSGLPAVKLPFTLGGTQQATDLFSLFNDTLTRLTQAIQ
ncbi:MAG TPA: zinc ABC transporter substrate-binding protein [Gammaproteobacteria bacterium]|nr:zinc ABC transporter substrate-binding protein [Gammaproteobacteria bacterium]